MRREEGALAGKAVHRWMEAEARWKEGSFTFPFHVMCPKAQTPVPGVVLLNFTPAVPDFYLPSEELCDLGLAVASFHCGDVSPDNGDFTSKAGGLFQVDRSLPTAPGKLALWAWGASVVREYLAACPEIDQKAVAVAGHSRLGKTALLAGALDPQFQVVFSNDSGCAGAALYRCMSKTKVTMQISLVMNAINVAGNAIGIFVLHAGVAGVAWPSTLSRAFAAVAMTALCFSQKNQVRLLWKDLLTWNSSMVRRLLRIAVPNSIENGLFQLAKVALSSITAMFGTVQIAANGVAQSIWSLAALVGSAMGPAFITVVGKCMAAGDTEAASYYMRKLTRLTLSVSIAWNALVLLLTPVMLLFYDLSLEAKNLVFWLVVIHNIFNAVAYPISGPFSNGLRAAGDVKFTMYISLFSTIVVRVALSIVLGVWMDLGVIGIALAMAGDWCVKAAILLLRYKAGKWKTFRVLG